MLDTRFITPLGTCFIHHTPKFTLLISENITPNWNIVKSIPSLANCREEPNAPPIAQPLLDVSRSQLGQVLISQSRGYLFGFVHRNCKRRGGVRLKSHLAEEVEDRQSRVGVARDVEIGFAVGCVSIHIGRHCALFQYGEPLWVRDQG